jgi:hypothetical protein
MYRVERPRCSLVQTMTLRVPSFLQLFQPVGFGAFGQLSRAREVRMIAAERKKLEISP